MTMTIGKEARDEIALLITSLPDKQAVPDQFVKEIISVLDRCTDAPEVGRAVAYQYEFTDPLSGNSIWLATPGPWNLQNPKSSRPLYAHPPEVELEVAGLVEAVRAMLDDVTTGDSGEARVSWGNLGAVSEALTAVEQRPTTENKR